MMGRGSRGCSQRVRPACAGHEPRTAASRGVRENFGRFVNSIAGGGRAFPRACALLGQARGRARPSRHLRAARPPAAGTRTGGRTAAITQSRAATCAAQQRLSLLTGGPAAPGRQRRCAPRSTGATSCSLPPAAGTAGLGVFVGGCTLEAAEQVADADLETLDALIQHSLLRHRDDRYTMLETVREYALEQLERAGEVPAARTRHGDSGVTNARPRGSSRRPAIRPGLRSHPRNDGDRKPRQAILLQVERQPEEIVTRVRGSRLSGRKASCGERASNSCKRSMRAKPTTDSKLWRAFRPASHGLRYKWGITV